MTDLPLTGIRVADFTRVQAGPSASQWLAIMGAEVFKLESRLRPDLLRGDSKSLDSNGLPDLEMSTTFLSLNSSKLSCTLNLTNPKAIELAKRLIATCDVVIENYSAGVMERFELDYPNLKELKPDIIMLSISGPGQTGPHRSEVAYATNIHAFTGLCSITGYPDGEPQQVGAMWADVVTGQMAVYAMLAALYTRQTTGEGQYIDLSMSQTLLATMPEPVMDYTMNQRIRGPEGNRDEIRAPHGAYRCKGEDQWVALSVANDDEWQALCDLLGRPDWCQDARFADQASRRQNQDSLDQNLQEWTSQFPPREAMLKLQGAGIAAGLSSRATDIHEDPHLRERKFFVPLEHPRIGKGELTHIPFRIDDEFVGHYEPSPLIGQHNGYLFREVLGLSDAEIETLVKEKVIF